MMIAITRSKEDAKEFISLVESINAKAIALDTIALKVDHDALTSLKHMIEQEYDYVLFMSKNSVNMLINHGIDIKDIRGRIIAIGPKTRLELEKHGIAVDIMPNKYSSYGIVDIFKSMDSKGKSILIPRSKDASSYLADQLNALGMKVYESRFYYSIPNYDAEFVDIIDRIDMFVFTSASNVHAFFKILKYKGKRIDKVNAIAIGPFTRDALKQYGIDAITADEHTIHGVFRLIKGLKSY